MKKNNLKIVKIDKNKSLFNYEKKVFKIMKKEKCLSMGVTIGGQNQDVYMPQFINFFKENLL